jgi:hypothetical protein
MHIHAWAERLNPRQRAVHSVATAVGLIIASTMFFSIRAPTSLGGEYDCGPAAYALFAGPSAEHPEQGNCRSAAGERLTTVSGLLMLTVIGSYIGGQLSRTPRHGPYRARSHAPPPPPQATGKPHTTVPMQRPLR